MANSNYMPNMISIKTLANSLRKGGLLPETYFKDRNFSAAFIQSAKLMGFHPEEAKLQIKTDQIYQERRDNEIRNSSNKPRN